MARPFGFVSEERGDVFARLVCDGVPLREAAKQAKIDPLRALELVQTDVRVRDHVWGRREPSPGLRAVS